VKAGDPITATVSVTNSTTVSGDEIVEAYVKTPQNDGPSTLSSDLSASQFPPVKPRM